MDMKSEAKKYRVSIAAFSMSIIALLFSIITFYLVNYDPGNIIIYKPTGYCIVRGYQEVDLQSDYIILPIVFENTGQGTKIIEKPTLELIELNGTNRRIKLIMAGFIEDLYRTSVDNGFEVGFSINIPTKSTLQQFAVFHIDNWWDENKPEFYSFQFKSGEKWEIRLSYYLQDKIIHWENNNNDIFMEIEIFNTIDRLVKGGAYNSDCFTIKDDI
jgi:hypothetical protein